MLFNFSTFNHCRQGRIIVEDITVTMGHQLITLGHNVQWTEKPDFMPGDDVRNVVLESFADDPYTLPRMTEARQRGCRFIIVATEEPTDHGFNSGLEPAMIARQAAFPAAAALADGILHLIPGDAITAWYSRHAPAAAAEIGFAPGMVRPPGQDEPDLEFGFYGKITWRRGQIIDQLRATGVKVIAISSLDVPRADRDLMMCRAKVILQIRANEEWGMVSSTRCASALHMGRPVIAEPHPLSHPWDAVVDFSESLEAFYGDALAALGRWRMLHAQQMERFAAKMTPEFCVGVPLRTIGIQA